MMDKIVESHAHFLKGQGEEKMLETNLFKIFFIITPPPPKKMQGADGSFYCLQI